MTEPAGRLTRRGALGAAAGLWLAGKVRAAEPAVLQLSPLELLDGSVMPRSAWAERSTVVVFFTTDCAFCRRHNARLQKLHESGRARVLGAVLRSDTDTARHYVRANGLQFAVTADDGSLHRLFSARQGVPLTCLVDRSRRLLMTIAGEMSEVDVMDLPRDIKRLAA